MEKGTYRIRRGSLLRNPENITFPSTKPGRPLQAISAPGPTPRTESQAISARLISQEKRLVLVVMFLVFATFCCFGTAYYLFTTSRWASVSSGMGDMSGPATDNPRIPPHHQDGTLNSVLMSNARSFTPSPATSPPSPRPNSARVRQSDIRIRPEEKFLSYLPHSGFHNQRIALENALVLSRLLNRTLLIPPVRFGRRAVPYRNFTVLQRLLDADYMAYLCQLSENPPAHGNTLAAQEILRDFSHLSTRCAFEKDREPVTHTYLPWNWITDLDSITQLRTLGTPHSWLTAGLDLRVEDVLVIPDTSKYHYRFTDEITLDPFSNLRLFKNLTYLEDIPLSSLTNHPAKLIQLGSLFGSHRLKLSDPAHKATRKQIRRHMTLKHSLLQKLSADIAAKISGSGPGSGFLGAHLRCNDSYFLETATEHSRMIWWKLVHGILGLSVERTRQLEIDSGTLGNRPWSRQFERFISPSNSPIHFPFEYRLTGVVSSEFAGCKGQPHSDPDLGPLNVPLFIATDSENPHTDRHLRLFRQTFPCTFFLQDFPQELKSITSVRDPVGGMKIGDMLVPFLDAMVVARAARLVGTPRSTFSWYVQDVLWRVNRGLDIRERGGG